MRDRPDTEQSLRDIQLSLCDIELPLCESLSDPVDPALVLRVKARVFEELDALGRSAVVSASELRSSIEPGSADDLDSGVPSGTGPVGGVSTGTALQSHFGLQRRQPEGWASWRSISAWLRKVSELALGGRMGALRFGSALVVCCALLGAGLWSLTRTTREGRLTTSQGTEFVRLEGASGKPARVEFSDGSVVAVAPEGRVVGLVSTAREFSVLLERGKMDVSVVPGGPRRWLVEAKYAQVEVVGTEFSVERFEERVRVQVRHGIVLVRSPFLPDGIQKLTQGQEVEVRGVAQGADAQVARAPDADPGGGERASAPEDRAPEGVEWPAADLAAAPAELLAGQRAEADKSPGAGKGAGEETNPSLSELLAQADRARMQGDLARAERALERVLRLYSRDPRALLAAYTLGVVRLGRPSGAEAAVKSFEWVLSHGGSRSLREDTLLRLVDAHLALGQAERARERAAEYAAWFPEGRHLRAIERRLGVQLDPHRMPSSGAAADRPIVLGPAADPGGAPKAVKDLGHGAPLPEAVTQKGSASGAQSLSPPEKSP